MADANRLDCHPEPDASQSSCEARGCCWQASASGVQGIPMCFFPPMDGYKMASSSKTSAGMKASLQLLPNQFTPYSNDVQNLNLQVWEETDTRLHFKISDADEARWEVPAGIAKTSPPSQAANNPQYQYSVQPEPFSIAVQRPDGSSLFDTTPNTNGTGTWPMRSGLIFENQYLEFSSTLPEGAVVYGLGEHITPLALPVDTKGGQVYTLLARDQGTPQHNQEGNTNLYASHPFVMVLDPVTGNAHGTFLLTSNALDVVLQQGLITYRVTGGLIDFFVFTGPTPADVVAQYLEVIGRPTMPPKWLLGFNLCRWGYENLANMMNVTNTMRALEIPQDTQWSDIDVMDQHLDFTSDPNNFPVAQYGKFIAQLHARGQHYVPIFDPAISSSQPSGSYPPFDDGVAKRVFIETAQNETFIGSVWPGLTAFPDFFAPQTLEYWYDQVSAWHDKVAFDGMWIDMNEPSNFCTGSCSSPVPPARARRSLRASSGASSTGTARLARAQAASGLAFDPIYVPYLPGRTGGANVIDEKTVSFNAQQHIGIHYNLHNMYGYSEAVASASAMIKIRGKRQAVIGRSTFPGSGVHQGHWLGDNQATWADLYYSIPGVLMMNMFGIPVVGADICGFNGDTTAELCTRWMQLGSFYPFMRNHNTKGDSPQEPYAFGQPYTDIIRTAVVNRYKLLPLLYTLFDSANTTGTTVARPLFFEWPTEQYSAVDKQFLWGSSLMVAPVLEQGATSVSVLFPDNAQAPHGWYNLYTGAAVDVQANTPTDVSAPLSTIPAFVRGGHVIPTQDPALTTVAQANNQYEFIVALDSTSGAANGTLFVDDGDSIDTRRSGQYNELTFSAGTQSFTSSVVFAGYSMPQNATLRGIQVWGLSGLPSQAACNGKAATVSSTGQSGVAVINCLAGNPTGLSLTAAIQIVWK